MKRKRERQEASEAERVGTAGDGRASSSEWPDGGWVLPGRRVVAERIYTVALAAGGERIDGGRASGVGEADKTTLRCAK